MNRDKTVAFMGAISLARRINILEQFGIKEGILPHTYLGIPLFKGGVTRAHTQGVLDSVKRRIDIWQGKLMSFQGRKTLVKHVLSSITLYNMGIYLWPKVLRMEIGYLGTSFGQEILAEES